MFFLIGDKNKKFTNFFFLNLTYRIFKNLFKLKVILSLFFQNKLVVNKYDKKFVVENLKKKFLI